MEGFRGEDVTRVLEVTPERVKCDLFAQMSVLVILSSKETGGCKLDMII